MARGTLWLVHYSFAGEDQFVQMRRLQWHHGVVMTFVPVAVKSEARTTFRFIRVRLVAVVRIAMFGFDVCQHHQRTPPVNVDDILIIFTAWQS